MLPRKKSFKIKTGSSVKPVARKSSSEQRVNRKESVARLRASLSGESFQGKYQSLAESRGGLRINRYLASAGCGSRREVEKYILAGRIKINDRVETGLDTRIKRGDLVLFDDKIVTLPEKLICIIFNKPVGYAVSHREFKGQPTIFQLLPPELQNLKFAGRLDLNSRGLLVLSNDGDFIQAVTHPSHRLVKRYRVRLNRLLPEGELAREMMRGVEDGGELLKALSFKVLDSERAIVEVALVEGRNRQLRRMFAALELRVLDLCRVAIGRLELDKLRLPEGKFVPIQPEEIFFDQNGEKPSSPEDFLTPK